MLKIGCKQYERLRLSLFCILFIYKKKEYFGADHIELVLYGDNAAADVHVCQQRIQIVPVDALQRQVVHILVNTLVPWKEQG